MHGGDPFDDVSQHAKVDPEEAAEGRVEVGDDVTQHGDREHRQQAHEQLHPVGVGAQEQDADEREEAEGFQERPSV